MASNNTTLGASATEDDPDDILADLEAEENDSYRKQRLEELQSEAKESQGASTNAGQAIFKTLAGDDECLQFTTECERAVVHFFHPDFTRCNVMDQHCEEIARKHNEVDNADLAFARVDVRNAPFVVEKLSIRVLPVVIGFVKGVAKGRVTGFDGIAWGGKEEGPVVTAALEAKLVEWTVLKKQLLDDVDEEEDEFERKPKNSEYQRRGIKDRKQQVEDEDDDWD